MGNGIDTTNIPICLTIRVSGDKINLDFSGTSQQVAGNINTTFNAVQASACYALIAALDSELSSNQGILDVVEINIETKANSKVKSTKGTHEAEEVIFLDKKNEIELNDDINNSRKTRRRSSANIE